MADGDVAFIGWFVPGSLAFVASLFFWRYSMRVASEALDRSGEALDGWRESNELLSETLAEHRRNHAEQCIRVTLACLSAAAAVTRAREGA